MSRINQFIFLCLCLWFGSAESQTKKYNLSICTIFKNEALNLKEWIEYHRLVGVDHFYLYNVESTDNYREALNPYIKQNIVTLIQWPNLARNNQDNVFFVMLGTRIPAYENAAKFRAVDETKWLAFVGVDEFLVPPLGTTLSEILLSHAQYPAVTLMSEYFDAGAKDSFPSKRLVIESLNLSVPRPEPYERRIKNTIFKPEELEGFIWPPYQFIFKENKQEVLLGERDLRVNHYINRQSYYVYNGQLKDRLQVDPKALRAEEKKKLLRRYDIQDTDQSILRFVPDVRKKLGIASFD